MASDLNPHVKVHLGDAATSRTLICLDLIESLHARGPHATAAGLAAVVGETWSLPGFCLRSSCGVPIDYGVQELMRRIKFKHDRNLDSPGGPRFHANLRNERFRVVEIVACKTFE